MKIKKDEFQCEVCEKIYKKGWSDEEANKKLMLCGLKKKELYHNLLFVMIVFKQK